MKHDKKKTWGTFLEKNFSNVNGLENGPKTNLCNQSEHNVHFVHNDMAWPTYMYNRISCLNFARYSAISFSVIEDKVSRILIKCYEMSRKERASWRATKLKSEWQPQIQTKANEAVFSRLFCTFLVPWREILYSNTEV